MPVTVFNQTVRVATPGGSALGVYGGAGLDARLTDSLDFGLHVDGSVRTDGAGTLSGNLGLGGTF